MPSESVYSLGMMVRTTGPKKPLGPQQCTDSGSCSDHWNLRDEKLISIVMSEITEINVPDSPGHTRPEGWAMHWPFETTGLKSWFQGTLWSEYWLSLVLKKTETWALCFNIVVNTLVNQCFNFFYLLWLLFLNGIYSCVLVFICNMVLSSWKILRIYFKMFMSIPKGPRFKDSETAQ